MKKSRCSRCRKWKPLSGFYLKVSPHTGALVKSGCCRKCQNKATVDWQQRNRARYRQYQATYAKANPERIRQLRRKHDLKKKYRLTVEEYDAMIAAGCCICKRKDVKIQVDHCHKKGHVRGGLCGRCNRGLGFFDDDPDRLDQAAAYLRQ